MHTHTHTDTHKPHKHTGRHILNTLFVNLYLAESSVIHPRFIYYTFTHLTLQCTHIFVDGEAGLAVIGVCGTGHDWYLCLSLTLDSQTHTRSGDDDNQQQLSRARLAATVIISLEIGRAVMLLFVRLLPSLVRMGIVRNIMPLTVRYCLSL